MPDLACDIAVFCGGLLLAVVLTWADAAISRKEDSDG